ncbi:MAG: methyltransferase [Acidobacteria bacterium]|nr:methyltransferase [Acidobacteriota bacterium]
MTEKQETAVAGRGAAVEIVDLGRAGDDFAADVRAGLGADPKTLSPRYFYDGLGSTLFEAICRLPEYYVTRAEDEILRASCDEIVAALEIPFRLVELGCGAATKTRHLIDAALRRQARLEYIPVDIDREMLRTTAEAIAAEYPGIQVTGIAATFEDALDDLAARLAATAQPALVLFLGSTIGNLEPDGQRTLLRSLRRVLRAGDAFLLGADAVKDQGILIPAYDDVLGVTAAFNRNLLVRINRELGGTFDVASFRHQARYDDRKDRIEMHLVSTTRQHVAVPAAGIEIDFREEESIHTESSYKFTRDTIERLARESGFRLVRQWTDHRDWFGENLLIPI